MVLCEGGQTAEPEGYEQQACAGHAKWPGQGGTRRLSNRDLHRLRNRRLIQLSGIESPAEKVVIAMSVDTKPTATC